MALITIENQPVLSATISMPRNGAWYAEAQTSSQEPLSGVVSISDESSTFSGTVSSGGVFGARNHVRVVGGRGGLGQVIQPRHYRSATIGKILGDICDDCGETKSTFIVPTLSFQRLSYWARPVGTGGTALANLADHLDAVWRVLPNGSVWLGDPGFALAAPSDFAVLSRSPFENSYTVAIDDLSLHVGMSQSAGQIQRIEYTIDTHMRAKYWVD